MPDNEIIYYLSLLISIFSAVGLGINSLFASQPRGENRVLGIFLLMLAVWSMGQFLLVYEMSSTDKVAKTIFNLMPFIGAGFIHLSIKISRRGGVFLSGLVYAIALALCSLAITRDVANIVYWNEFGGRYIHISDLWLPISTILFLMIGCGIFFSSMQTADMGLNRQARAYGYVGLFGISSFFGFFFVSFGIQVFPYPVWLWPAFIVLSTYALYRYTSQAANQWAIRVLGWVSLVTLAFAIYVSVYYSLYFKNFSLFQDTEWQNLIIGFILIGIAWLLRAKFFDWAQHIVYFRNSMDTKLAKQWQKQFKLAQDTESLRSIAQDISSEYLGQFVGIQFSTLTDYNVISFPRLTFNLEKTGWKAHLEGWDIADPAFQNGGETICGLVLQRLTQLKEMSNGEGSTKPASINPMEVLFANANLIFDLLQVNKLDSSQLLPFTGAATKELDPFKKALDLDVIEFHSKGLITEMVRTSKDYDVKVGNLGDDVELSADADKFKEVLLELFALFEHSPIRLDLKIEDGIQIVQVHAKSNSGELDSAKDDLKKKIILHWLKIIHIVRSHKAKIALNTSAGGLITEVGFPINQADAKQAQA